MKRILISVFVAAAATCGANAHASPFGADYSLDEAAPIADSVRETPWWKHPVELVDVFEHAIGPDVEHLPAVSARTEREIVDAHEGDTQSASAAPLPQPRNRKE